jgi:hypothetical protein
LPGINPFGDGLNNVVAAATPIARHAVVVIGIEPMQNAGAMQKIVNQRIDGDHAAADLDPKAHTRRAEKDAFVVTMAL